MRGNLPTRKRVSLVFDLGEWWKRTRNLPLPLGGIVIRKDIPLRGETGDQRNSARKHRLWSRASHLLLHSMGHARGLDVPLADRFIGMCVNELTLDYGKLGRAAVSQFSSKRRIKELIPPITGLEFVS